MEGSPSACRHRDRVTVPDHIRYSANEMRRVDDRPGVGADGSRVRWKGCDFGVVLTDGQAVVELAEEAVEQVAQRGGVPVAGCSAAVVVDPCPAEWVSDANAQVQPAEASRSFLIRLRVMTRLRPDARVTGAEPA
jgi:hypothetical protein